MASVHPSEASSAASTPRSEHHLPPPPHRWHHHPHPQDGDEEEPPGPRVRLMCSFGGRILPRPHDHQLRYVGGETRIVAVPRAASFSSLLSKVATLLPAGGAVPSGLQIKYQLPQEDLDALISVTSDEDVEIMMEEHERLASQGGGGAARTPRLRLFLFAPGSGTGPLGSLHDGGDDTGLSLRRERWFLDALNSGAGPGSALERGRSEVSSVVSELPDYLSGMDTLSDLGDSVHRAPVDRSEPVHRANDYPDYPESPVRRAPDHPHEEAPVKLTGPPPAPAAAAPPIKQETAADEPPAQDTAGMYPGGRTWQYVSEPVPVYYVSASVPPQQTGPVPVPLHVSYGSQPGNPAAVQAAYRRHPMQVFGSSPIHASPVYVGGLPAAHAGPYGFPVSVPRSYLPAGGVPYGHGPVNPVAAIPPPRQDLLPDPGNNLEQGLL